MGIVESKIKLSNAKGDGLNPVEVNCIVDTGATYLCIPESKLESASYVATKKGLLAHTTNS